MDAEELRLRCAHGEALMIEAQTRRELYAYLNKDRLLQAHKVLQDSAATWLSKRVAERVIRQIAAKF